MNLECCKDVKNFNSMFAILSGLDHKSVQRLQATWERVPEKYKNIFEVISNKKEYHERKLFFFLLLGFEIYS